MLSWRKITPPLLWLGLLTPLMFYGSASLRRASRDAVTQQPLFQGITYSRQITHQSRPQIVHLFDIDLTAPGIKPLTTPGYVGADLSKYGLDRQEVLGQTTSDFLSSHGLQLAINANFFYKFREVAPWNYYPRPGQTVNLVGIAISDGKLVSPPSNGLPALCFIKQQAIIDPDGLCPTGTQQAVAGNLLLLANGEPTKQIEKEISHKGNKPYPFTVAALDATGTRLWLVLADGKQPLYSEGITLSEITQLMQDLGVDTALRLDGGGSTTGVISTVNGPKIVNNPTQAKIPGRERPIGNHLGFFARPMKEGQ